MIVVLRFEVPDTDQDAFAAEAARALEVLARRPGYLSGTVGRATDDPSAWVLVTHWLNTGSYRRALGGYDVKLHATPLLSRARDEASAFEPLITAEPGSGAVTTTSDRAT